MKQTIYFCNNCDTPFDKLNDGVVYCPKCGLSTNIESYDYNTINGNEINIEEIIVRMNDGVKNWFYEMFVKLLKDLLTIEVEIKNKRYYFIYNLNSIIYNIKYMTIIMGMWKTHSLTSGRDIFVYSGYPGCLITDADWKDAMEKMMSVKHSAERLLSLVEMYSPVYTCDEKCPNWVNLEEEIDEMIKDIKVLYRFFKYGTTTK